MLLVADALRKLDFAALMDVYIEGNLEKAEEGMTLLDAEENFRAYLRDVFFQTPGGVYYIWLEGGRYVSALRLEPYRDGWLLEALETAPEQRRKGFAERLLREVLAQHPDRRIYSHVGKRNRASLRVHEKCGFRRILDHAVYIDGSVNDRAYTLYIEARCG